MRTCRKNAEKSYFCRLIIIKRYLCRLTIKIHPVKEQFFRSLYVLFLAYTDSGFVKNCKLSDLPFLLSSNFRQFTNLIILSCSDGYSSVGMKDHKNIVVSINKTRIIFTKVLK